jgi:3-dehydroquinate synthase
VVGDLAGFVAASYMRGIRLVQIPTTLLAQVDSSVGGKVGVDLSSGKNLVGAFWPPVEVRIAVETLKTLPERHFWNGMAEVWKYGLILDESLFGRLLSTEPQPDEPAMERIIERCVELKAAVVEADEFESTGRRAILNFGHTIGHAIEQVTGYGPILHGEAIAAGMIYESMLGERLGVTPSGTSDVLSRSVAHIAAAKETWSSDTDGLIGAMKRDKKATGEGMAFSLLTRIGECRLVTGVSEADVRAVLM